MRNVFKYIGLAAVIVILAANTFMINKLIQQNYQLKSNLWSLQSQIGSLQNYQSINQINRVQQPVQKDVMTPLDLANYLGIKMDKVYSMVENKATKIPYVNIDGEYKFSKAAIDEWMKSTNEITTIR